MEELWDVYDINRNKTGKTVKRANNELKEGEYHIVVNAIIINSKDEILLSKRAPHKNFGLLWECNGGSILAGETSVGGVVREVKEELGIDLKEEDAIYLKGMRRDKLPPDFRDFWLFRKDVPIEDVNFPDGEAIEAKWASIDEFLRMVKDKETIPMIDFGVEDYNKALKLLK